jgi:hypothetical protein
VSLKLRHLKMVRISGWPKLPAANAPPVPMTAPMQRLSEREAHLYALADSLLFKAERSGEAAPRSWRDPFVALGR